MNVPRVLLRQNFPTHAMRLQRRVLGGMLMASHRVGQLSLLDLGPFSLFPRGRRPSFRPLPVPSRPTGCDSKGLLGAVALVRGVGRRCRCPLATGCTGGRRRIPHVPGGGSRFSRSWQTGAVLSLGLRRPVRTILVRTAVSTSGPPIKSPRPWPWAGGTAGFPKGVVQKCQEP